MANTLSLDELHEHLKDFSVAMLTTVTREGYLHARPMMTQKREPDADLWFVSAMHSDKVDEMRANPKAGVIYFRDRDNAYVSLTGDVEVVQDRDFLRNHWKEEWRVWFPEGPDQADLCMIKVAAREAEYWEPKGGKLRVMFDVARGAAMGQTPDINPPVKGKVV
jgi:general stress protein 26